MSWSLEKWAAGEARRCADAARAEKGGSEGAITRRSEAYGRADALYTVLAFLEAERARRAAYMRAYRAKLKKK